MMWNSFISSYRFITKSKTFTVINLIGLVAGLTASFLLLAYLINEFSFNSYHTRGSQIYRVIVKKTDEPKSFFSPFPLIPLMQSSIHGINKTARLVPLPFIIGSVPVSYGNKEAFEPGFYCADKEILDILSFSFISGTPSGSLTKPNSILLSERAVQKYFGNLDPIGKVIHVATGDQPSNLFVTGVFRNLPWNSTLDIDFITNMDFLFHTIKGFGLDPEHEINTLESETVDSYILLDPSVSIEEIELQTSTFLQKRKSALPGISVFYLNIKDIYLNSSDIPNDFHKKGNKTSLLSYSLLAFFVLMLAGINYSILSTARSSLRFKEIGVRKVLGATKAELRIQLITESVLLTFIAFPLSFLLLGIIEPYVAGLYGYTIQLYSSNMIIYIPLFAGITILIGFLSGINIALLLSSLSPLQAFKNKLVWNKRFQASKAFIVFQLFITLSLFSGTMIIYTQLIRCLNHPVGIQHNTVLRVPLRGVNPEDYRLLKEELIKVPEILFVSGASIMPPENASIKFTLFPFHSSQDSVVMEFYKVDYDFFSTMGIKIIAGRDFDRTITKDYLDNVIINQEAVRSLKMNDPLDKVFNNGIIIGIVNDFTIHSFQNKISPAAFSVQPEVCQTMAIRFKEGKYSKVLKEVTQIWQDHFPQIPLKISSFGEELESMYKKEVNFGKVVASFTLLAFIITGMGLFGLIVLLLERRGKEIAIRKVFGASDSSIIYRMQKEFLVFILIASLLSVPITWIIMSYWLNQFYYRETIHWWIFAGAILSVLIFVLAIILIRTWIVLKKTPASVLKYE